MTFRFSLLVLVVLCALTLLASAVGHIGVYLTGAAALLYVVVRHQQARPTRRG